MPSELTRLLVSQFIAYLLCNFILIPSYYVNEEQGLLSKKFFRSIAKAVTFFTFSFLLTSKDGFLLNSIILSGIVGLTNFFFDRKESATLNFVIAQAIQLISIFVIIHLHNGLVNSYDLLKVINDIVLTEKHLWVVFAYLICLGPANVIIKLLLKIHNLIPSASDKVNSLLTAGRFIGNIERIITLTLVFNNQYEAIGLLIAAKSLLRLKDTELKMSEYVLVGTLLSFGVAILIGLLIKGITEY